MMNIFVKVSKLLYSTGVYENMSLFPCDNHPWEQNDECEANNQQFQD